jgi:hypothetical protein
MLEAVSLLNLVVVLWVAAGVSLAGPLAIPCGLCSRATAAQLQTAQQPFYMVYAAHFSSETAINRTATRYGDTALSRSWSFPMQAACWVLLPVWCVAGSNLRLLWSAVATLVFLGWQLINLVVSKGLDLILLLAWRCCMLASAFVHASALLAAVPISALVDALSIPYAVYTAVIGGTSAWQSRTLHACRVCLAEAKGAHAELRGVFIVCNWSVKAACCRVLQPVHVKVMRWALSEQLHAIHTVGYCAATYMAAAWCNRWRRRRLVAGCNSWSKAMQARVVGLWECPRATCRAHQGERLLRMPVLTGCAWWRLAEWAWWGCMADDSRSTKGHCDRPGPSSISALSCCMFFLCCSSLWVLCCGCRTPRRAQADEAATCHSTCQHSPAPHQEAFQVVSAVFAVVHLSGQPPFDVSNGPSK